MATTVLSGQKTWISAAQHAQKVLILVRTTPLEDAARPADGLSLLYTDLDRERVSVAEIDKMGRAAVDSNAVLFDGWRVPAADRIGAEGRGFSMVLQGMDAERILIGAEALGLGFAALRRAAAYAGERVVFGRPNGQNQGIQHPLADAWMRLESARLVVQQAARLYDGRSPLTSEYANAAKYLAAFAACERAVLTHRGIGLCAPVPRGAVSARGNDSAHRASEPGDDLQLHSAAGAGAAQVILRGV